ncbi:hypothetical protein Lalb_Chr12g0208361 [Lupinus albus]|uniref:Uncharacterized protein n=1 Tax=Lupinus albus TaxID=3870 RepID=A0A6A4PNY0_LUPAL|nr:hypothetical protein Lalb_Chr12g0208361 [Lupinus albus]
MIFVTYLCPRYYLLIYHIYQLSKFLRSNLHFIYSALRHCACDNEFPLFILYHLGVATG